VITEGYFQAKSTTDFNGLYRGEYIDFEAKETKNKTRFPLANIHEHQLNHMKQIVQHGGICFMIIRFTVHNETYLLQADKLFQMRENSKDTLKSLPYKTITQAGYEIPLRYSARVDYVPIIDHLYFWDRGNRTIATNSRTSRIRKQKKHKKTIRTRISKYKFIFRIILLII